MASLYLNEDLHADAFRVGARIAAWGPEARHASQVARIRTGERIAIGDGRGRIAWGRVVVAAQSELAIEADEIHVEAPARPEIWLVQALAKGDRDELAVQAATELGVAGVVPWAAARSVSRWEGPKVAKGVERWRAIVREASKQSIRPSIPVVLEPADTAGLTRLPGTTLVLEPDGAAALGSLDLTGVDRVNLVVGPEGGIADHELAAFETAGASLVRLGPEVLRTSTAGPAAIAAMHALLGHW